MFIRISLTYFYLDVFSDSCKDIAMLKGAIDGEYSIYSRTSQNMQYKVFCEFHQTYGYSFVSNTNVSVNVDDLFEIRSHVVRIHSGTDNSLCQQTIDGSV